MAPFRILLPYNFSVNDEKAIRFAIDLFAGRPEVRLTLFHAYTPPPEFDEKSRADNARLKQGMTYLTTEIEEKSSALEQVGQRLVAAGLEAGAVDCEFKKRFKSVAEEIVERVAGCNVLVLSRGAGRVTHFFTRSIYARVVVSLRGVTICVAT